jgi:hypothetical protein
MREPSVRRSSVPTTCFASIASVAQPQPRRRGRPPARSPSVFYSDGHIFPDPRPRELCLAFSRRRIQLTPPLGQSYVDVPVTDAGVDTVAFLEATEGLIKMFGGSMSSFLELGKNGASAEEGELTVVAVRARRPLGQPVLLHRSERYDWKRRCECMLGFGRKRIWETEGKW